MVAYFFTGQRLTSALLEGIPKPLGGKMLIQSGTYLTTSGGTELKLPKLALTGITVASNAALAFRLDARLSGGSGTAVANDIFEFRVRQANDTSGTIVWACRYTVPSANQTNVSYEQTDIPQVTVSNESFYLSVIRITGSGVLGIESQGGGMTSFGAYTSLTSSVWSRIS